LNYAGGHGGRWPGAYCRGESVEIPPCPGNCSERGKEDGQMERGPEPVAAGEFVGIQA